MTVPMKALREFPYAGRRVKKGQQFNARTNGDARLLCAIGHAEKAQTYNTRVMVARPSIDLDTMDLVALRDYATRLGVKFHHMAGAKKIREAISAAA